MKNKLFILTTVLTLQGCESTRETLGLTRHTPNEYAVQPSSVPLQMPPDYYSLPTPTPGATRPQEAQADVKAHEI